MMTQSQIRRDSLAIAQLELELYIAQQASSTAPEEGGNYEVQNTIRAFLSSTDPNAPESSETNPQTIPCREPAQTLADWYAQSRDKYHSLLKSCWLCGS